MNLAPAAILFGALFSVATAWSLGVILLRRLKLPLYREEEPVYAVLLGAALLSAAVFLLCAVHLAFGAVFAAGGALAIAAGIRKGIRPAGPSLPGIPPGWAIFLGLVAAAYLALYLVHAMAPEISPDAMRYHLAYTARYWRDHGFRPVTTDLYANYSQGMEMLFVFAFAFGRHSAAALTHLLFLPALAWLILCHARRHQRPREGAVAAILVLASPVVGVDAASAYNDVAVATVLFAIFGLTDLWLAQRTPPLLAAIGLLVGFGYAIKYTAVVGAVFPAVALVWTLRRKGRELARALVILAIPAACMAAPWIVKNAVAVGNPFSPLFNSVFPNPAVDPTLESEYRARLRLYPGITSYRQLPRELAVNGEILNGLLGPVFLLAPIALMASASSQGRRTLAAMLLFASPYFFNIGTRFLIPALPLMALAMASAFMRFPRVAAMVAALHAIISWPAMVPMYAAREAWRLKDFPLQAAFRVIPEDDYLRRNVLYYRTVQLIDRVVPSGERVFTLGDLPESYLSHEVIEGSASSFGRRLRRALWTPLFPEEQPRRIARFPFPPGAYQKLRIVQTTRDPRTVWSVTEFRVYRGNEPLQPQPSWRIGAHPNSWLAALAFDNDAVTRWTAGRPLRPGMFIEVGFPAPVTADSVMLRYVPDQDTLRLKLEGSPDGMQWTTLNEKPECFEGSPPLFLRKMAARDFLRNGIRYFVVAASDFGHDDFARHPRLWGIADLGEADRAHVYRFDSPEGAGTERLSR